MSTATRGTLRSLGASLRAMILFTLVLGVGYTALIIGIGQLVFPAAANGSLVQDASGTTVGSALIGQNMTDAGGAPSPLWFQSRPSAAGSDGYDAMSSGGSNLGPNNPDLVKTVEQRRAAIAAFEGVVPATVPADAVTASASGLDPDIWVAYAELQVPRIARERGLSEAAVRALVTSKIEPRDLGFLGEPRVNVLELNLALAALAR